MNPLLSFMIAAALAAAGSLSAQTDAQISVAPTDASSPPPSIEATPPPVAPAAETPVLSKSKSRVPGDQKGKIQTINAAEGTFTVESKTFRLSKKIGMVFVDGTKMSLGDLKDGDLVAVTFFEQSDGSNLATRVIKGSGRKHSKKAKGASGQ